MRNKLKSLIVPFIISLSSFGVVYYLETDKKLLFTALVLIIFYLIFEYAIGDFFSKSISLFQGSDWRTSQRRLEKEGVLQNDTQVRISFAYLYRIKIDDKYFLVFSKRTKNYQPVGGAYKFYKEEADYLSENIPAESDDCIPVDEITKRDYRLLIKNKDLKFFMKRFNTTLYRESITNLSREFVEELFTSRILEKEGFGDLTYKYCGRHITNIEKTVFNKFEILLADIVEVKLTDKQEGLFRELLDIQSTKYKFATAQEIKNCGVDVGKQKYKNTIGNHTHKILIENTDNLIDRNKYKLPITVSI